MLHICLMHHLLFRSGQSAVLLRSVESFCMSSIACKERVDQRFIASFMLSLLAYTEPMHTTPKTPLHLHLHLILKNHNRTSCVGHDNLRRHHHHHHHPRSHHSLHCAVLHPPSETVQLSLECFPLHQPDQLLLIINIQVPCYRIRNRSSR